MTKTNNILLFVGSGISYDTGIPDVQDITYKILNDEWYKYSDQTFKPGIPSSPYEQRNNIVPRLQDFLNRLRDISDPYLFHRTHARTNYEDLFYICQQIKDDENREIENPAISPFIDSLKKTVNDLFTNSPRRFERIHLRELASHSCNFIKCAVEHLVSTENEPKGLDLINELVNNTEHLDIATINHDLLLEKLLRTIPYNDGFDEPDGDVRFFNPDTFNDNSKKINIFKLHGSINWYIFLEEMDTRSIYKYGIPIINEVYHCKNSAGKGLHLGDAIPFILIGSYNKLSDYNSGIYHKIHSEFEDILWDRKLMIMSGYGWNDRGINVRILEWLSSSLENKLVLLHRNPEEDIKVKSKSPMWHRWDDLVNDGRLIPIKKWLSEITLTEIQTQLNIETA